ALHRAHRPFPTRRPSDLYKCGSEGGEAAAPPQALRPGAPRAAQTKALTKQSSFWPAEASTPVVTSTPHGRTSRMASATFSGFNRSEEHTSELQSPDHLVC